jgi:dTDP-4-amino-4,6-dideoxygalactose transaminase
VELKKIWLSSPHMGTEELERVKEAFADNWIAPLGPHVDGFERDLAQKTGVAHAAALSSGTAAIHLALVLLDVGPGDDVVCQSMTFSASANPIAYLGATPVFVDSESTTWNMDPNALRACLVDRKAKGKSVKAVIPVHLYGMPAQMDELREVCAEFDVPIIEDAAEALGATYKGRACGSFGRFGILSFNGNKIITTSGGGALISDDADAISRARYLATQARDPAPHYQHSAIGYNYRMSNVLAGIGRGQMQVLDERVEQRRANHDRYRAYFRSWNANGNDIRFQEESEGSYSNRWLTTILVDPATNHGLTRETIRLALNAENIESRPLWKPMHLQPVFQSAPFYGDGTSERLFDHGLCLPSGSNLTGSDFDRIFELLDRLQS